MVGHPTHNCCFCQFFLNKKSIYSAAERLYDQINPEMFQTHAPALLQRQVRESNKRGNRRVLQPVSIHFKARNKLHACNVVVS